MYIRKDIDTHNLTWPIPFDNGLRLKDVLDEKVDESYYINTEKAQQLIQKLLDDGVIGAEPSRAEPSRLISPSKIQDQLNLLTAYQQERIEESAIDRQRVPVYVNYNKIDRVDVDIAQAILSRDYKGFGTSNETSNGVVEKN